MLRKRKNKELNKKKGAMTEDLSKLEIKLRKRLKVCDTVNLKEEFKRKKDY